MSRRRGVRRPLLPHLRHHHHVLRRRPVRPCAPCVYADPLCGDSGGDQLHLLCDCRICSERCSVPAAGCGDDCGVPVLYEEAHGEGRGVKRRRIWEKVRSPGKAL